MNEKVGFTDDGFVFFQFVIDGPGGQPAQITLTYVPQDAALIAKNLTEAADRCKAKTGGIIIQPGGA